MRGGALKNKGFCIADTRRSWSFTALAWLSLLILLGAAYSANNSFPKRHSFAFESWCFLVAWLVVIALLSVV